MSRNRLCDHTRVATIGVGTNPVRWQAQSSKLLNVLWVVGRFDFDWFPPG
jgi:hypothetical protein